jgi:hypothetical protein
MQEDLLLAAATSARKAARTMDLRYRAGAQSRFNKHLAHHEVAAVVSRARRRLGRRSR